MTTPIERLRALHKPCVMPCFDHAWVGDRHHCAGPHCLATWPCDTVAALDALEEGLHELLDARPTRGQLFQRLDAATVLIRQAMNEVHLDHYRIDSRGQGFKRIDTCENCRPYREWLEGEGQ